MTSDGRNPDYVGLKPMWKGDDLRVLNDDDVVHLLRAAVEREGSQIAVANRIGIDRASINAILNGKRPVSGPLVKALGLRKVYIAEQEATDRRTGECWLA